MKKTVLFVFTFLLVVLGLVYLYSRYEGQNFNPKIETQLTVSNQFPPFTITPNTPEVFEFSPKTITLLFEPMPQQTPVYFRLFRSGMDDLYAYMAIQNDDTYLLRMYIVCS
jgi:hypothetical protein